MRTALQGRPDMGGLAARSALTSPTARFSTNGGGNGLPSSTGYSNATPFWIVLLEPFFRGVHICEHLDVIGVADPLTGVDVDEEGHRIILCLLTRLRRG
jgi:hypothetical protein